MGKQFLLRIYFFLRLPLILLVRLCVPVRVGRLGEPEKILLIRLDRLGDFVLSLPVVDSLRAAYPKAQIHVLVRPYLEELARLVKNIDEVIVFKGFWPAVRALKRQKYDTVIDLLYDYPLLNALLAYFSGALRRIGFNAGFREIFFTAGIAVSPQEKKGMADLHLALLASLGVKPAIAVPQLNLGIVPPAGRKIIAVHPGGCYPTQRWSPKNFALVAKKIAQAYPVRIAVVGSPQEKALIEQVVAGMEDTEVTVVCGSLREFTIFLAQCALLICNNSGPLHLAAALGVPTVSVMGPTDPALFWPKGDNNLVIRKDMACSPCQKGVCRRHSCLAAISAEEVFERSRELIDKLYAGQYQR